MGYGDGIRRLPKWKRVAADLVRLHAVELILGLATLGASLIGLGKYLSR